MPDAAHAVHELLPLAPLGEDAFEAVLEGYEGHAFGGSTLGCATLAAARTCETKALASIHAHFLRPASAGVPVRFEVERVREGRRLSHRRVRLLEEGKLGFELFARFDVGGTGPELSPVPIAPSFASPEALPDEAEVARTLGWDWWQPGLIEQRWSGSPWQPDGYGGETVHAWVRLREALPADPALQMGLIAYLSDVHSHFAVARSLNARPEPDGFTSLDESIWFHRQELWDDWWLLTSRCVSGHAGRALTTRELRTRDGRIVATMQQEALIPDPE